MKTIRISAAVAAALALMAVSASAASATTFQSSSYPNMAFATQVGEHIFIVDGQEARCKKAEFESTSQGEAQATVTVGAKYAECKAFSFVNATVKMNSCHYRLNEPSGSGDIYSGTVSVLCSTAAVIEINASTAFGTCEVRVGEQGPLSINGYTNVTAGEHAGKVEVSTNVTGIKANVVKDTGICPLSGTGLRENAFYEGFSRANATGGATAFIG